MPRSDPDEIDLHGLHVEQALARFAQAYAATAATRKGARLIVIHGWNASEFRGSIAAALHRLLKNRAIEFEYPFEGNRGRTTVRTGPPLNTTHSKPTASRTPRTPRSLRGGL
ncbi:MAG: Smr/MutS family protein [Phycisphaerae bacterium]|nr:Smr/MutS family protein [Phycisphaerae bacterium]